MEAQKGKSSRHKLESATCARSPSTVRRRWACRRAVPPFMSPSPPGHWGAYLGGRPGEGASASRPRRSPATHVNVTMPRAKVANDLRQLDPRQPRGHAGRVRRALLLDTMGFAEGVPARTCS